MTRSGYSEDCDDNWQSIMWRGRVASSTRGKRGQSFLRDLLAALDAMPVKRLIAGELEVSGEVCAIGSLGAARGVDMSDIDADNYDAVAAAFGIAAPLAQEVVYMNDEAVWGNESPEHRWSRMRAWVEGQIKPTKVPA